MDTHKYFNFPITLLKGFLTDSKACLDNISYYSLYQHSISLDLGGELDKFKSSASFYEINLHDVELAFREGRRLYENSCNAPKCGLNLDVFLEYRDNEKSEFEKVTLLGFLAIKSILGKKTFCKLDNKYWLSRMSGESKSKEISELDPKIQKYSNEYQTKKIKTELKHNWRLKTYSRYTRGFYVSFKLDLEALIFEAEKKRKTVKEKQSKMEEKALLEKVLSRLNKAN